MTVDLSSLTLDQLRLLVLVAEEGTFTAAARRLHRAQSAVSYGIATLEQNLGVELFDRSHRRPHLTAAGRGLLADAREVLDAAANLASRAAAVSEGLELDVSLVVDAIVPPEVLVDLGRGFQARFPNVSLHLHTDVLEAVVGRVRAGAGVIGIAGPIVQDEPGLACTFLGHIPMVTVAAAEHPLAHAPPPLPPEAARKHTQIVITDRGQTPSGPDRAVQASTTWRVADAATKLTLIRAGLGWGNLPLALVEDDLATGALTQLTLEAWGPGPMMPAMSVVTRRDAPPGPAGQWLVSSLFEVWPTGTCSPA